MLNLINELDATQQWILMLLVAAVTGAIFYIYRGYRDRKIIGAATEQRDVIVATAKREAEVIKREAMLEGRDAAHQERERFEKERAARRGEDKKAEERNRQRETALVKERDQLTRDREDVDRRLAEADLLQSQLKSRETELRGQLEKASNLTADQAKAELLKVAEDEAHADASRLVRRIEDEAQRHADEKARHILTVAIERYASEVTSERTVSTVELPSDEVKGRIIGREGRNIREFERLSGTDLVIDDTPKAVTISCFDPVRRAIGVSALRRLVSDGRIHPSRIAELLEKAEKEIDQEIRKAADEVAYELGIHNLRSEVLQTLGRLKYRTSYGQNVLAHSLEVAHIGALLAAEIKLDVKAVKRACLLHDIGKAIDHEVEGPHALVGADLLKRYGEAPVVINAVAGHHCDVEQTIEAIIVQVSDAISAARPGVRMESAELYVKRLESIEKIATSFPGVAKAYAIQAGREVRVFVNHDKVNDVAAKALAKKIAKSIETDLSYPGQIRITVIRETKFTEYAR